MPSRPSTVEEIIRQRRELAALSMRQLAEHAGIPNPYLSQIERGVRAPSEEVLDAIARTLKVSPDALYEHARATRPGAESQGQRRTRRDRRRRPPDGTSALGVARGARSVRCRLAARLVRDPRVAEPPRTK